MKPVHNFLLILVLGLISFESANSQVAKPEIKCYFLNGPDCYKNKLRIREILRETAGNLVVDRIHVLDSHRSFSIFVDPENYQRVLEVGLKDPNFTSVISSLPFLSSTVAATYDISLPLIEKANKLSTALKMRKNIALRLEPFTLNDVEKVSSTLSALEYLLQLDSTKELELPYLFGSNFRAIVTLTIDSVRSRPRRLDNGMGIPAGFDWEKVHNALAKCQYAADSIQECAVEK